MDYLFENLGPEEFQRFCQVLISKEFPNVQCYPIGQPDGGRDAISYTVLNTKKEFIVFQVKFVRKPMAVSDIHKWLTETIKGETKKINRLIPLGATKYYLLTNIPGTAHLNSGSIDQVNKILEDEVKIPSMVWWRDDLSVRFEKDPIFKWSFPEIINGQDILNSGLFEIINENRERRENAIRAYLKDQYNHDKEVKFRQIELVNRLYDLFTDVPLDIKRIDDSNNDLKNLLAQIIPDPYLGSEGEESIGAIDFLLHPLTQDNIPRILLEGGPGQGKSTVSQYLCQVHRSKLLKIKSDIDTFDQSIRLAPVKLPFKIDLRHVSTWLNEKNPYSNRLNDKEFSQIWRKSLEAFIIAHIRYHSQLDFDVNDFLEVSKKSPILLVFDGFDEIADFDQRKEVIEFIDEGASRLESNAKSLQIIVTSRPAAFSDSIEFSTSVYPHFELKDITPSIIGQYVENWIKSAKLSPMDADELRNLVNEKLELSHLKDLAKSPMQLAIFISLLRTKGRSLPDQRTALYDNYIGLFFDRESEKNEMIREKRELIIEMHQYLAWVLHSEAELLNTNGSMDVDQIQSILVSYLQREKQDTSIAGALFNIMNERVCALVSRIQGTFEFEVQPLREYFCAKYLYNTAPPSNIGNETGGSLPDRFDAIAKSIYWQNVVRFFAGCFRKAELPLLQRKLEELGNHRYLRYTNYPAILRAQLLSDNVFTQYQSVSQEVIESITREIKNGRIKMLSHESDSITLPISCGKEELVDACFERLRQFPPSEEISELTYLIRLNFNDVEDKWLTILNQDKFDGKKLTVWFKLASDLNLLYRLDKDLITSLLLEDGPEQSKRFQILLFTESDFIFSDHRLLDILLSLVMNAEVMVPTRYSSSYEIRTFISILNPYFWKSVFRSDKLADSLSSLSSIYYSRVFRETGYEILTSTETDLTKNVKLFIDRIDSTLSIEFNTPRDVLKNLDVIIETGREILGEIPIFTLISSIAAMHKLEIENEDHSDLNNNSVSLLKRIKYVRLKSGNLTYWKDQLEEQKNERRILFLLLSWGTQRTITALLKEIDEEIISLSEEDYRKIVFDLLMFQDINNFSGEQSELICKALISNKSSNRLINLLALRTENYALVISESHNLSDPDYPFFEGSLLSVLMHRFRENPENRDLLEAIKDEYARMVSNAKTANNVDTYFIGFDSEANISFSSDIRKEIIDNFQKYPQKMVSMAEHLSKRDVYNYVLPVGRVADEERWFEQ